MPFAPECDHLTGIAQDQHCGRESRSDQLWAEEYPSRCSPRTVEMILCPMTILFGIILLRNHIKIIDAVM